MEGFNGILKPRQRGFQRLLRQQQRALLLLLLLLLLVVVVVVVVCPRRGESRSSPLSSARDDSGDGNDYNGGYTGS